ncbi:MAG: flagellar hook-basal body complex protein [Pseudomonadota bacterium]
MSLFGSLITGVSGLKGQSTKMGAISDNIANVSTVGFKRVDVQFSTLVTERLTSTSFQPGGVQARPRQLVDQQGILQSTQSTQSTTDLAVSGRGMFVVSRDPELDGDADPFYTRAGSFRPDNDGNLKNSAGFYLQGLKLDQNGDPINPDGTSAATDNIVLSSLQTINLNDSDFTRIAEATTNVRLKSNLPAQAASGRGLAAVGPTGGAVAGLAAAQAAVAGAGAAGDPAQTAAVLSGGAGFDGGGAVDTALDAVVGAGGTLADQQAALTALAGGNPVVVANGVTFVNGQLPAVSADFTQNFEIFDSQGSPHTVTYNWTRVDDPTTPNIWAVQISGNDVTNLRDEDTTVADDQLPEVNFNVTGSDGNEYVTNTVFMRFNGDGSLENVFVPNGELGTAASAAASGLAAGFNSDVVSGVLVAAQNRATSTEEPPEIISVLIGNVAGDPDTVAGGFAGTDDLEFDHITFDGTPGSFTLETGVTPYADNVAGIDGNNGALATVFNWDVGRPTRLNSLDLDTNGDGAVGVGDSGAFVDTGAQAGTGLDGYTNFELPPGRPVEIETSFFSQNGQRLSDLVGVEVDEFGLMSAIYDNGASRSIFRLPLADFNNVNGLINASGNVYRESAASGDLQLGLARSGGNGDIVGNALESSNVDLGDEFTNMIITQQAFTANTRVISTTDQMVQELVNIIR